MTLTEVRAGYHACPYPEKTKAAAEDGAEKENYAEFLHSKIEELSERFRKGETKPSYRIGAQSFTEKEWDQMLEKFDALQETIRTQMREEHEKRELMQEKQAEQTEKYAGKKAAERETARLLTGAFTSCTYPQADGTEEEIHYITCYTSEGIFCRREGQSKEYEWSIRFDSQEQYQKVMHLIEQLPPDGNLRFTSSRAFWEDFLNDSIDRNGLMKLLSGTDQCRILE